jgi:hypothetical protein
MANGRVRKIILSVLLIIISLVISLYFSSFQYSSMKDNGALQAQLTRKLAQVGSVWVNVKIVSGIISVLETLQVEGSVPFVGGLAVSAEPLGWTDVADNILDLISHICLLAMGTITIEKLLLAISLWVSLRIVVPACAFFLVIAIWNHKSVEQLKKIIGGLIIISAGICFAIPLSLELSNIIETSILSDQIDKTIDEIDAGTKEAEKIGDDVTNSSFIDKLKNMGTNIVNFFGNAKQTFDAFVDTMINYIMCFVVTNIIIPIGTILGLKQLIGFTLRIMAIDRFGQSVRK